MATEESIDAQNFGFIGSGNMSQTVMKSWIDGELVSPQNIFASNRSISKLQEVERLYGVNTVDNNEKILDSCDVIILGIKPQDFKAAIEPIASSFRENHIVLSLAAGIDLDALEKFIPQTKNIIRVMTNTPAKIRQAVIGYCIHPKATEMVSFINTLLSPMGLVVPVKEGNEFEALTVSTSSGIGFLFEFMTYWQEWLVERGFKEDVAKSLSIKTFLGAALLADQSDNHSLKELQEMVVSKKGVTAAGLDSMRESGLRQALACSFEKAILRDQQLGKDNQPS